MQLPEQTICLCKPDSGEWLRRIAFANSVLLQSVAHDPCRRFWEQCAAGFAVAERRLQSA